MLVTFEKDGCCHRNILSSIKKMNLLFLLILELQNKSNHSRTSINVRVCCYTFHLNPMKKHNDLLIMMSRAKKFMSMSCIDMIVRSVCGNQLTSWFAIHSQNLFYYEFAALTELCFMSNKQAV